MPKATFFNLPAEKRTAILQAAVDEFAAHPYAQASVNRIVDSVGIAKGSFYQYFENKKDLYLYLLEEIGKQKMAYLAPALAHSDQKNVFDLLREFYAAGIRFVIENPAYAEIGKKLLAAKGTPIYREITAQNVPAATAFFEPLLQSAMRRGEVRPEVDIHLAAHLLASLSVIVNEYHLTYVDEAFDESMMTTATQFIDVLQHGLGIPPPDSNHTHAG